MSVSLPAVASSTSKPNNTVDLKPGADVAPAAGTTIEQALKLRDTLRSAARQAGELARSLKQQNKQSRLIATTLASLKGLQKAAG